MRATNSYTLNYISTWGHPAYNIKMYSEILYAKHKMKYTVYIYCSDIKYIY